MDTEDIVKQVILLLPHSILSVCHLAEDHYHLQIGNLFL